MTKAIVIEPGGPALSVGLLNQFTPIVVEERIGDVGISRTCVFDRIRQEPTAVVEEIVGCRIARTGGADRARQQSESLISRGNIAADNHIRHGGVYQLIRGNKYPIGGIPFD